MSWPGSHGPSFNVQLQNHSWRDHPAPNGLFGCQSWSVPGPPRRRRRKSKNSESLGISIGLLRPLVIAPTMAPEEASPSWNGLRWWNPGCLCWPLSNSLEIIDRMKFCRSEGKIKMPLQSFAFQFAFQFFFKLPNLPAVRFWLRDQKKQIRIKKNKIEGSKKKTNKDQKKNK